MTDRRRTYEIFVAALEREETEREAFLSQECGADGELRCEVDALLLTALRESPLTSALLDRAPEAPPSLVGMQFGNFRLRQRLGMGGMGVVYLADRVDGVPQRVAIKLLLGEVTGAEYARFEREARLLARLEHPSVARLIDTGVQHGRTWIALDYVSGKPIDVYCEAHQLGLREQIGLLLQLVEAVVAAHRMLVVHRDIKPANVLVTDDGLPKLIDFGIGAALAAGDAEGSPTLNAARMFTPNYSSPEQIGGGPVTVATDIFGLGALAYRLLSGCPPFPHATEPLRYMLAVTQEDVEPPSVAAQHSGRPHAIVRGLRGDLDAILLKALATDPAERYSTAQDLAADFRRHLQQQPVLARKQAAGYRLKKFVRRHIVPVSAGAILLVCGIVAGSVYIKQARAVTLARDMAIERDKFLESLLTSANPTFGRRDVMVADLLDRVIKRPDTDISADPLVAASILGVVSRTEKGLGRYQEALAVNDRQLALVRMHAGDSNQLVDALNLRSLLLYMTGRAAEAEAPTRETLEILHNQCGGDGAYADTLDILGEILSMEQREQDAEAAYRQELECVQRFHGSKWDVRTVHTLNNMMLLNKNWARTAEALAVGSRAIDLAATVFPPDAPYRLTTELNYADTLAAAGRAAEAEPLIRDIMARRTGVLGPDAPETLMTDASLAYNLLFLHRDSEAATTALAAAHSLERVLGPEHPVTANAWQAYGIAACRTGQGREGLEALHGALTQRVKKLGTNAWQSWSARASIGSCLFRLRRYEEAEPELLAAVGGLEATGRSQYFATQSAYADLRDLYAARGDAVSSARWNSLVLSNKP
jgi:eukaryotic-like serine/threonine-protein kinase